MENFDNKVKNNLIFGIIIAFLSNTVLGVAIIILNEMKLKNAIKNNNVSEIEFTQKIIDALIKLAVILFIILVFSNLIAIFSK